MTTFQFKVGDQYSYENRRTGVRYKGQVVSIEADGRIVGTPTSYWPKFDILLDVNGKSVPR